jgi:hypothetical protein
MINFQVLVLQQVADAWFSANSCQYLLTHISTMPTYKKTVLNPTELPAIEIGTENSDDEAR